MRHADRLLTAALIPSAIAFVTACGVSVDMPHGSSQTAGSSGTSGGGGSTNGAGAGGAGTGGTNAASTGTGGAGSVGAGGEGGAGDSCIPFSEPPGAKCSPSLQCKSTAMSCSCGGMGTVCHSSQTGEQNDVHPPNSPPPEGGCCDTEGLVCGYETCGPICRCTNGAWACQAPDVCPSLQCPDDPSVLDGQHCEQFLGQSCSQCSAGWACTCELQLTGAALWECFKIPC